MFHKKTHQNNIAMYVIYLTIDRNLHIFMPRAIIVQVSIVKCGTVILAALEVA